MLKKVEGKFYKKISMMIQEKDNKKKLEQIEKTI